MTTERVSLGSELLLARPLTDEELEQRYGAGRQLRRSDEWFEMYEEPLELPLSSRRKYLTPVVGLLIVGAAVLAGYALQKNDWRAITDAQRALRQAFNLEAPAMAVEPIEQRDRVLEVRRFSAGPVVRLSTAVAEASYDRAEPEPEPAEAAPARPAPEPRSAARRERRDVKPTYTPPAVTEGSSVIEAPVQLEEEGEAADDAGTRSIEAPSQPSESESEPSRSKPDEPDSEPALPVTPDYGI